MRVKGIFLYLTVVFGIFQSGCATESEDPFCSCMHGTLPMVTSEIDSMYNQWFMEQSPADPSMFGLLNSFKAKGKVDIPSYFKISDSDLGRIAIAKEQCAALHSVSLMEQMEIKVKWEKEMEIIQKSGKIDVVNVIDAILNTYSEDMINSCFYRFNMASTAKMLGHRDLGLRLTLPQALPPCDDCPEVLERDILSISMNSNSVKVEGTEIELEKVEGFVNRFYLENSLEMPQRIFIGNKVISDTTEKLQLLLTKLDSVNESEQFVKCQKYLKKWAGIANAYKLTGEFHLISKRAVIRFESTNDTPFEAYFSVLDQIKGVLKKLRNDLAIDAFGRTYDELIKLEENGDDSLRPKIQAIRVVYPLRLLEPDSRNY